MSPYSGRALSGRGQICRDREQASLNPVASHVVVESIIVGQLYQCFHMVGTPFVGSCVGGIVTFLSSCIDSHVSKPVPATFDLFFLLKLTGGRIMSADTAVTCTF